MRYRLQAWCFFVHKSLKKDNKKENEKELKVYLWDDVASLKLPFLKSSSQ